MALWDEQTRSAVPPKFRGSCNFMAHTYIYDADDNGSTSRRSLLAQRLLIRPQKTIHEAPVPQSHPPAALCNGEVSRYFSFS